MPRWAQSIRFRLSLAYALAVFATGAVLLAVLMLWQMQQLDQEFTVERRAVILENAAPGSSSTPNCGWSARTTSSRRSSPPMNRR